MNRFVGPRVWEGFVSNRFVPQLSYLLVPHQVEIDRMKGTTLAIGNRRGAFLENVLQR